MNYDDKENKISAIDFPSDDEKRRFLTIYQQEIKKLNIFTDFDEHGSDSVDNLMMESMVGEMVFCIFFSSFMLSNFEDFSFEPSFFKVAQLLLQKFGEMRQKLEILLEESKGQGNNFVEQ